MAKARYVRLYADADGESHFSDEEMELRSVNFAPPAPPLDVSAYTPTKQFAILFGPRGWVGDWHPAPTRQFMIWLSGETDIEVSDGEVRRFKPGSLLLMENTIGKGHVSRVAGGDVTVAVVQLADSSSGHS
jgi:hypothetical protein